MIKICSATRDLYLWVLIPTGAIKKRKKEREKFSKIFDDISSDIMAVFL
jgi:hypothetical protein